MASLQRRRGPGEFMGTLRSTEEAGSTFSYTLNGSYVAWIGADLTESRAVLFAASRLDSGVPHTITLDSGVMSLDDAERDCVPESSTVEVPDDLDPAEVVSLVFTSMTAYKLFHRTARVKSGETVLVRLPSTPIGDPSAPGSVLVWRADSPMPTALDKGQRAPRSCSRRGRAPTRPRCGRETRLSS